MSRQVVAAAAEVEPGKCKIVSVRGREIGIFNLGGEFFALANRCPHAGGPLCLGQTGPLVLSDGPGDYRLTREREFLRCPWHGWEYDIRSGQSWYDPIKPRVGKLPVAVEPGAAIIGELAPDPDAPGPGLQKGPYVAETYPVSVEQRYIVVDLPD